MSRVLVTGGAGFVGANLAIALARRGERDVVAVDNLKRRGSELNLGRLGRAGVAFAHADVRARDDLLALGGFDALIECSAEPSALAGQDGSPDYVVHSNLVGAYNCLELARRDDAFVLFLSTSRVYPTRAINALRRRETDTRFELAAEQSVPGASAEGIAEDFPLEGPRTLYGATKLAVELLITEYREAYGLRAAVNRCGVIAGPWQMGKVDQGVFTYWLAAHHFGRPLEYIGFGGRGLQVRDLLHVDDLVELVIEQVADPAGWDGFVGNVGGGRPVSLSLAETTAMCRELTGNEVPIGRVAPDRPGDVFLYLSDCRRLYARTDWRPRRDPRAVLSDIHTWLADHAGAVGPALGFQRPS
jgi:CDP-paratose 2-epimerase